MRRLALFSAAAFLTVLPTGALAQSYNPNAGYENPYPETTEAARRRGPCSDPWVTIAQERVFGRADQSRCNIYLYNNGQWRDFNQLIHTMAARLPKVDCRTASWSRNGSSVTLTCAGIPVGILASGAFYMDRSLYASIVAAGGGNLVGQDGAGVVATDGAGIVAGGGGNLSSVIERKLDSARLVPASGYSVQSFASYQQLKASTR